MLYCVSYINGIVGVFSSMEAVTELVLNRFFSLPFIIQVYRSSNEIVECITDSHIQDLQSNEMEVDCIETVETSETSETSKEEVETGETSNASKEEVETGETSKEEGETDETSNAKKIVWIIMYKNMEMPAFVTDNKDKAEHACKAFNVIGKVYEDVIDYYEQEIDTISSVVEVLLDSFQSIYSKNNIKYESCKNIIYY